MAPIKYLLFDCDNTLVLSEALAFEACADLTNEILANHNIKQKYSGKDLMTEFVGQNFRGMMRGLESKYDFSMDKKVEDAYVDRELGAVTEKLMEKCEPCPGVHDAIEGLKNSNKYQFAVVSTSALPRVVASIEKTDLIQYFNKDHIYSAATSLDPPTSKPDPAIYLHAMKMLGTNKDECVAIEDSKSGATAAKRAGIPTIGYVGVYEFEGGVEKENQMEKVLRDELGAVAIMRHWSEIGSILDDLQAKR